MATRKDGRAVAVALAADVIDWALSKMPIRIGPASLPWAS